MASSNTLKKIDTSKTARSRPMTLKGTAVAVFSGGMALVDTSGSTSAPVKRVKRDEQTNSLIRKVGAALERPGVSRKSVFPPGAKISFAYAVDPEDPSILVRRSAQGKQQRGRLVYGRFEPLSDK